jgi:hypothetical protein
MGLGFCAEAPVAAAQHDIAAAARSGRLAPHTWSRVAASIFVENGNE